MSDFKHTVELIEKVYKGTPWYGKSVKAILTDVSEEHNSKKSGDSHSVLELIHHMAAWKNYVIEVLSGNYSYTVTDEMNFPNDSSIQEAIQNLDSVHDKMIDTISSFDYNKLYDQIPDRKYRYFDLIHGIIHHDIYHAGQIALLMK